MMINRLSFLVGLFIVVVSHAGPLGAADNKNVLVIVADDMGCDAGCYGNPQVTRRPWRFRIWIASRSRQSSPT
jgi:hypothetical protein